MNGILMLGKPSIGAESEGEGMGDKPGLMEAKSLIAAFRTGNPEKVLTAWNDMQKACPCEGEGEESETETDSTDGKMPFGKDE